MELAEGGELLKYVSDRGVLKEVEARKILLQIVDAICCCHMRGIVHRDLKLENVMFKDTEDCYVKVIDFGISGVCTTFQADKVDAGTVAYMPPECFEDESVASSPSLDVWAIGLMFYAMLYGTLPFYAADEATVKKKIKAAKLNFPKNVPVTEKAKEVCSLMLKRDPSERLELIQMMDMEYYKLDDQDFQKYIEDTEAAFEESKQAQEEAKNEEEKLGYDFDSKLYLPADKYSGTGGIRGISPGRADKKTTGGGKKPTGKKASNSSPRAGGMSTTSGAKTSHKNKKTTK